MTLEFYRVAGATYSRTGSRIEHGLDEAELGVSKGGYGMPSLLNVALGLELVLDTPTSLGPTRRRGPFA